MRFLLSRRWLVFGLVVALLTWLAVALGNWQFRRLDERETSNARIERNLVASPVPVGDLMKPGRPVSVEREWRQVTATGTWDAAETVVVRYRTRNSQAGVDLVTPLRLADGTAVLVDRGWLKTDNVGTRPDKLPDPGAGQVTVSGWVRVDATGDAAVVEQGSTRAISSRQIQGQVDYPLRGGFLELHTQTPAAKTPLGRVELPEISDGPHFFYGLQWWFFGALAVFGFGYLLFDEWRRRRQELAESQPAQQAPVDGE